MNHDTVIRTHTPERYILGDLPPRERDEFEDHLADCSVCRQELAALDIFAANAAAVFEDAAAETREAGFRSWFESLRLRAFPVMAFSGVLNVALLVLVGYGLVSMARNPGARPGASDIFVVRPPARSAGNQVFQVGKSKQFAVLEFDLTRHYQRYAYSLDGVHREHADLRIPADAETLALTVPVNALGAGDHQLEVYGWDGQERFEIGRCVLRVQAAK